MSEAKDKIQLCVDGLMELYDNEPEDLPAKILGLHQLATEALAALDVCQACGGSRKVPDILMYSKWCRGLREEDEELGHGLINRTSKQRQELYNIYVEDNKRRHNTKPCPKCQAKPSECHCIDCNLPEIKPAELSVNATIKTWPNWKRNVPTGIRERQYNCRPEQESKTEPSGELRERLAELAHEQWSGWIRYMFGKCDLFDKDSKALLIPGWAVERWVRQSNTDFAKLSDKEKDSDRTEADKFLAIFNNRIEQLEADKAKAELLIAFYLEGLEKSGDEIEQLKAELEKKGE